MITIGDVFARKGAIFDALAARKPDLARYAYTIDELQRVNVSCDARFQRTFNGLYMVRRNSKWRRAYFSLMETHKRDPDVRFEAILDSICDETGRIEASFASKLIATINPTRCVYDSIVRTNLGLPARSGEQAARMQALASDYAVIQHYLEEQVENQVFQELRSQFDRSFPEHRCFSDIKVLDLMIWQMREV